jgi:hypothetical protein
MIVLITATGSYVSLCIRACPLTVVGMKIVLVQMYLCLSDGVSTGPHFCFCSPSFVGFNLSAWSDERRSS